MNKVDKYKLKIQWGFFPESLVMLMGLVFTPFSYFAGWNKDVFILSIICLSLILGIVFGSSIKVVNAVKGEQE
jgi:hypothetical protein